MKKKVLTIMMAALTGMAAAQTFTLKNADPGGQFTSKQLADGFGCSGENISPGLQWENAPKETGAFAVTMYDMDAPTGSGLWHWVVCNIPVSETSLAPDAGNPSKNNLPKGALNGLNDIGVRGYFGPCPPSGQLHRYIITVYALKEPIRTEENTSAALTGFMLNANALAKASLLIYAQQ